MNLQEAPSILNYWRAAELFSLQSVPESDDPSGQVFTASEQALLPWSPQHPLKSPPQKKSWSFQVFCGIYTHEKMQAILEEKFGSDPESLDERLDSESCLFALTVNNQGLPNIDSFILASSAWATAQTLVLGIDHHLWLEGFDSSKEKARDRFIERIALCQQHESKDQTLEVGQNCQPPLSYRVIQQATLSVAKEIGFPLKLEEVDIRIKAKLIDNNDQNSTPYPEFFNSFFAKDLQRISSSVHEGEIGIGLKQYLTPDPELRTNQRVDIRTDHQFLFKSIKPSLLPFGRWPTPTNFPLVFSQQLAINRIFSQLEQPGLFSINGPPGTGKTTLLRDLIAAVIVKRAICLSKLQAPGDAFQDVQRWKSDKYTRVISIWKPEFKGFEIVVASSNNGAVENISHEIPDKTAIDESWLTLTDYFTDSATRVLGRPAWGLISARLGNRRNRNQFTNRFWYQKPKKSETETDKPFPLILKELEKQSLGKQSISWSQATQKFQDVLSKEKRIRSHRENAYLFLGKMPQAKIRVTDAEDKLQVSLTQLKETTQLLQDACRTEEILSQTRSDLMGRYEDNQRSRPGLLRIILSIGRAWWQWRKRRIALELEIAEAQKRLSVGQRYTQELKDNLEKQDINAQHNQRQVKDAQQKMQHLAEQLKQFSEELGDHFPNPDRWTIDEVERELSSPWVDYEWNQIRAELFLAALELHKAFIAVNADAIRKSLHGAMDIIGGSLPQNASQDAIKSAWTTLFFVIPVVSTTFASFDRLFSHIGQEDIGWLLIDEAGQAVPQAAVGAIWRSQRTVVVGDPLQLQPVFNLPFTVQQALRKHYKVGETWLPGRTSVQELADRVNPFGTYLKGGEEPIWVGAPLRVHRRCDRLMFEISNAVAYDNMMVYGKPPEREKLNLPPSHWEDIQSWEAQGNWIPAEGNQVESLLNELVEKGTALEDIFLISPFRAVVAQLKSLARRFPGIKTGTIHTVQGKESSIVILVLGGDPTKPGAKKWASQSPNLINVAVSRAKRRLYIIGNRKQWSEYEHFDTCSRLFDEPK